MYAMVEQLLKIGELGAVTVLGLSLLVGITIFSLILYLFFFKAFPRMHGEAMATGKEITHAIQSNTEEIRGSRRDSEVRHDVVVSHLTRIMKKQEEMHADFLSDADEQRPPARTTREITA